MRRYMKIRFWKETLQVKNKLHTPETEKSGAVRDERKKIMSKLIYKGEKWKREQAKQENKTRDLSSWTVWVFESWETNTENKTADWQQYGKLLATHISSYIISVHCEWMRKKMMQDLYLWIKSKVTAIWCCPFSHFPFISSAVSFLFLALVSFFTWLNEVSIPATGWIVSGEAGRTKQQRSYKQLLGSSLTFKWWTRMRWRMEKWWQCQRGKYGNEKSGEAGGKMKHWIETGRSEFETRKRLLRKPGAKRKLYVGRKSFGRKFLTKGVAFTDEEKMRRWIAKEM